MDLGTAFAVSVRRQPDAVAVVDGERRRTFAQWNAEIRAAAGALARIGLKAGDHLAVVMRTRYEMATLYWASHMLGLIFTPVSWRGSLDEIAYCLEDCDARAVAYDGAAGGSPAEAAARLRVGGAPPAGGGAGRRAGRGRCGVDLPDALYIRYDRPPQGRTALASRRARGRREPGGASP